MDGGLQRLRADTGVRGPQGGRSSSNPARGHWGLSGLFTHLFTWQVCLFVSVIIWEQVVIFPEHYY